ncbi:uncharacterized protein JCM6883_006410 [Sporobolomyces salmoneus]|uniref:uncharacterized protein n=1 Tax=Sporobolomyces salmoneus TaxID=183962 RepID=UPI00316EA9CB
MLDADQLRNQVVKLVASLPPDENPYLAISNHLRSLVLPGDDSHARRQLYALAGIFALIAILAFLSLWIRWRKGVLWFVRSNSTGMWRFHFSASWAVPGILFLCLSQVAMEFERQQLTEEGNGRDFMYWLTLPWLALVHSGVISTWAILSSHVAQLQARGKWTSTRSSRIVNACGIFLLSAFTILFVPPAVLSGKSYASLIGNLDNVNTLLLSLSREWTRGPPNLSTAGPTLESLRRSADDHFRCLQVTFSIFAASSILLAIVMSVVASQYLVSLRKEIKSIEASFLSTESSVFRTTASHFKLRRVWKTILLSVGFNVIIAVLLAINSLMIAVEPEKLAHKKHLRIAILLPFYSVGSFGLLSATVLLLRAIEAQPSDERLIKAVSDAMDRGSEKPGVGKLQESEASTMVGSTISSKEGFAMKDFSRRSSCFDQKPNLSSRVLVEIEVVIDEERTARSNSRLV